MVLYWDKDELPPPNREIMFAISKDQIQLIRVNPVFRELHDHNVKGKQMKKQQSVFKLIGKLARILIGLVQRGETFVPEKVSCVLAQAA